MFVHMFLFQFIFSFLFPKSSTVQHSLTCKCFFLVSLDALEVSFYNPFLCFTINVFIAATYYVDLGFIVVCLFIYLYDLFKFCLEGTV